MCRTSLELATRASGVCEISLSSISGSRRYHSTKVVDGLCTATARKAFPSRRNRLPNFASQSRTAFASMASNTGSSARGELLMTRNTSEVAVCCSSASASFFLRSVLAARRRSTSVVAFVVFERRRVVRVRLFAPLRDKITSSAHPLVPRPSQGPSLSILTEPHDELLPL